MMKERMDLRMDGECKGFIKEIQSILQESDSRQKRGRKVSEADAVRYALQFTHKQLTEVLNVEDLDR
ncbi:MAG: hypothetical protein ACR2QF_03180 [Geminicoccaceae bacterium]